MQNSQLFDGRKKWDRRDSWRACVSEKQRLWEAWLRWWLARKRSRGDVEEGGGSRWSEIGEEKTRGWLTAGVELRAGGSKRGAEAHGYGGGAMAVLDRSVRASPSSGDVHRRSQLWTTRGTRAAVAVV